MPADAVENGPNGPENPGYDFARIKTDILEEAKKDAAEGSDSVVFNGFYNHDNPRRRYARVIKGDFSDGFSQENVEYDENLTAEDTDDIRNALYEQFGATPPPDEEFDKQKKPSEDWRDPRVATVDTPTTTEGVIIRELRQWRVLHEDIAAEHGIDPLDFTQWGIRVIKKTVPVADKVVPLEDAEHIPGWNASEGDVQHVQPESGTTEDAATGLSMAETGDEERSKAASNRRQLRFMDEYAGAVREARKNPFGRRRRLHELSWRDPRFETSDDRELLSRKWDVEFAAESRWGRERLAETEAKLREEAGAADERAEKQEAWAKVLHEHPVSEAFKQAHPHVRFGPKSLAHIEDWLPRNQKEAEDLIKAADSDKEEKYAKQGITDWLDLMEYSRVPEDVIAEFDNRLKKLDDSDSSTNGDYQRLYRDTMRTYAQQALLRVKEETQMLEDIRSGRASQPPNPTEQAA